MKNEQTVATLQNRLEQMAKEHGYSDTTTFPQIHGGQCVCPTCGRCPTCGAHRGAYPWPFYPQPYQVSW